ncbi:hypothetical protein PIROE2DRAFT_14053 [Piromyces sp. E2]|nr:hypothetical protein PIROE2DRAFT_14053 [Piromyces sp. E2]|eukprot:OUM60237.1 hypothetical protein PIROE2DRAFT_14053 [Piromyces sp. E2]
MIAKYLYIISIFFLIFKNSVFGIEIEITYDNNFQNINKIIANNQDDSNLILKFTDKYYDFSKLNDFSIDIPQRTNISFIGIKSRTRFDFNNDKRGSFVIVNSQYDIINYAMIFKNCIFRYNELWLFGLEIKCSKNDYPTPNLYFENCDFQDNKEILIRSNINKDYVFTEENKCLKIKIKSCNFNNNRGLFQTENSLLNIENCTFTGIQKDSFDEITSSFFYSDKNHQHLIIKDSIFYNIYVNSPYPLIHTNDIKLEIENTTFSNCHTDYGYLFNIGYNSNINNNVIIKDSKFIDTTSLFQGKNYIFKIDNTEFRDFYMKKSISAISDTKFSTYYITDTTFESMK